VDIYKFINYPLLETISIEKKDNSNDSLIQCNDILF
jgi:hypothetical protein